jgi:hypothetical protein
VSLSQLGAELRGAAGKVHLDKILGPLAFACFCAGALTALAPGLAGKLLRLYIR